jgi:predicted ATPase/DNA-binding SARP family transcriptional activator/DNA-binding CsgD family transcriptional regulator
VGSRILEEGAWRLRKAANLVKLLALSPGHRLHREQLMDVLWPDLGRRAASNNLRGVIHAARRTLGPDPVTATHYLTVQKEQIVLCPEDQLWADVEAFEEAAAIARGSKDPAAYRAAIELYSGELLPEDRYEEWAEDRRREFSETYISLWLGLAWAYEEREDYGSALDAHRRVTKGEPTNEEAHAGLMRLHALSGRKADALRQYELLQEAISQELGTAPSASTRALREEIASGRFPPEAAWPLSVGSKEVSEPPRHNLPIPRTSFVGRGRELTEIKRTLAMTRLLTLTGTGGSGKTRLALSVATELAGAYPDGAWFVELAGLSEPELVPQAIAGILNVREQPGRTLVESVADSLREQRTLLILDNCEHLVDAAARLIDFLFGSCSHLKVLATSREPLGVEGEVLSSVPPLSVPAGHLVDPGVIGGHDSVRLFLERTRMRLPDFSLTRENAAAVAEVCKKVEGIPLAIELAAARMGVLAAKQVAEKLEDSLDLLSTGARTASPRQRTMRAAIGWSHALLSEGEQQLFARLSTFSGGFTLEAAEAVCPGGAVEEGEILDLLSALVDKSLVVAETAAEARVHYRMLEPIRQYAQERLEEGGEAEAIRNRHAAFFLELAERAEPQLKGPGQVEWLKLLEEDNDNLRTAMAGLLEKDDYEAAVQMAHALWIFWMIHGHQGEGRLWIEEALAKGKVLSTHAKAKALSVQFSTYYGLGNPERMEQIAEEAAASFREVGDKLGLAYALSCLATVKMQQGDAERAIALFEGALDLGRELGDKWGVSGGLGHLGSIYLGQGDYEQARRHFEEGLATSRQIGNKLAASTALYGLAMAALGQGDHGRAAELYTEGLKSSAAAGDKANMSYCLEGLAQVAAAQGETERATRLFGAAEAALEAASGALYAFVQDRSVHEQMVEVVRSQLDEATFLSAWAKGAAMSMGETVEYALSGEEAAPPVSLTAQQQPSTAAQQPALTRREEEVAALVARGLTNRQIATELSISEHTVATHLGKIMRKLGLSSRSQLAAWTAEQQGSPSPD